MPTPVLNYGIGVGAWERDIQKGKGSFGTVFLGRRMSDKKLFAVKSVYFIPGGDKLQKKREESALSSLINEIRTLRKLRSNYIVRYIGCGTSYPKEMGNKKRLVLDMYLEFLPRGSLQDVVDRLGPEDRPSDAVLRSCTKDILNGLAYLERNYLVHGDIKCSNIVLSANYAKLADFGSVKDVRTSGMHKTLIGTLAFMAPKIFKAKGQTYRSDIFSLGRTVLQMANMKSPNHTPSAEKPELSINCQDFLCKCLAPDPKKRLSAAALLEHPWMLESPGPEWKPSNIRPRLNPIKEANNILHPDTDGVASILPENNDGPISPIHTQPGKKRKTTYTCKNMDDSSAEAPAAAQGIILDQKSDPEASFPRHRNDFLSGDNTSTAGCIDFVFDHEGDEAPSNSSVYSSWGDEWYRDGPKARTPEERKYDVSLQLASLGSLNFGPDRSGTRLVASLKTKGDLVEDICEEFDIPLPTDYEKVRLMGRERPWLC